MISRKKATGLVRARVAGRTLRIGLAPGVHPIDDIARAGLERMPVRPGDSVLDLGCGAGLYGLSALCLGAASVVLADIDPRAVACARSNARRNRLAAVECLAGDFFSPVKGRRFDLIIANLPQTPGPAPFLLSKWGGADGTLHLRRLFREAPCHLTPGGCLYFILHDLADSRRIERLARRRFELRSACTLRREFDPAEYDGYSEGLFDYLDRLRRKGIARFHGRGRHRWFRLRFLTAAPRS